MDIKTRQAELLEELLETVTPILEELKELKIAARYVDEEDILAETPPVKQKRSPRGPYQNHSRAINMDEARSTIRKLLKARPGATKMDIAKYLQSVGILSTTLKSPDNTVRWIFLKMKDEIVADGKKYPGPGHPTRYTLKAVPPAPEEDIPKKRKIPQGNPRHTGMTDATRELMLEKLRDGPLTTRQIHRLVIASGIPKPKKDRQSNNTNRILRVMYKEGLVDRRVDGPREITYWLKETE